MSPVFDPWEKHGVPDFPFDILPPSVQQFVASQSAVIGCDASALAMSTLVNFSGALDHRFLAEAHEARRLESVTSVMAFKGRRSLDEENANDEHCAAPTQGPPE